jgi:hypothetical protein
MSDPERDFNRAKNIDDQHLSVMDACCAIPEAEDEAALAIRNAKIAELLEITSEKVEIARDMILIALLRKDKKLTYDEKLFFWSIKMCPEAVAGDCTEREILMNCLLPVFIGCEGGAVRIKQYDKNRN